MDRLWFWFDARAGEFRRRFFKVLQVVDVVPIENARGTREAGGTWLRTMLYTRRCREHTSMHWVCHGGSTVAEAGWRRSSLPTDGYLVTEKEPLAPMISCGPAGKF